MKQQTKMVGLTVILGLLGIYFHPHADARVHVLESITCVSETEAFVVPLINITHAMSGLNGNPDCMSVVDTTGKVRVICNTEESNWHCYYSENMEI